MRDDAGSDYEREEPTLGEAILEHGQYKNHQAASKEHKEEMFVMWHSV